MSQYRILSAIANISQYNINKNIIARSGNCMKEKLLKFYTYTVRRNLCPQIIDEQTYRNFVYIYMHNIKDIRKRRKFFCLSFNTEQFSKLTSALVKYETFHSGTLVSFVSIRNLSCLVHFSILQIDKGTFNTSKYETFKI